MQSDLRGRPEKHERHEMPELSVSKSLGNGSGRENGIARIAAAMYDERRREEHENS